ncbi:hypothetical protein GBA52_026923 [Prunus armeniaca]|nr:hypothetical protein GBA52_026923 [Prunus armeniaca]
MVDLDSNATASLQIGNTLYQCCQKGPDALPIGTSTRLNAPELSTCMIARGALVKLSINGVTFSNICAYRSSVFCGLLSCRNVSGVETTRRFLLEWLSYTCRYVPVGLLEVIPQRLSWRPPSYFGRDDLETLMASDSAADWVRISEMLLGKVPDGFTFAPKHKSNSYDRAENG